MEDVAGQTLGVDAHEHALLPLHLAEDERDMLVRVDIVAIADHPELAERRGKPRLGDAMHQPLVSQPVRDELRDGDERECVLLRKRLEVGTLRGGAVGGEDLADDAGRLQAGETHEIDGRFGVADALQHAAFTGAQRVHVPRTPEIRRQRIRVRSGTDRRGPIGRGNSGRHAELRRGVDRHGEGRAHRLRVFGAHHREIELRDALGRKREADHSLRVHQKIHARRRNELGGADEVAFVFAVFVIGDDDELSLPQVVERLLNSSERHMATPQRPRDAAPPNFERTFR